MPSISIDKRQMTDIDELLKLIRMMVDRWPTEAQAVFFLKMCRQFEMEMKKGCAYLKDHQIKDSGPC